MSTQSLYGPPRVGGDVLAYCTKCKIELAHVIVSMLGQEPVKVLCKTCRGQHNYKRAPGTSSSNRGMTPFKRTLAAAKVPKEKLRAEELWQKKLSEKDEGELVDYAVHGTFSVGQVVRHSKFGLGVVETVHRNGKIHVLFRDGEKILIHKII